LRLLGSLREVLTESIASGGSSISDYVDAEGARGAFQESHRVYGRSGTPCLVCGALIRRIVLGQRGTHFCPRCQRRR
jgi:formamidopyrimidine-DNA glycosylase